MAFDVSRLGAISSYKRTDLPRKEALDSNVKLPSSSKYFSLQFISINMQFSTVFSALATFAAVAEAAPVADTEKLEACDHYCRIVKGPFRHLLGE